MFSFRYEDQCEPRYMTEHSAAADLLARTEISIPAGGRAIVPTGVWIAKVNWEKSSRRLHPRTTSPQSLKPRLQKRYYASQRCWNSGCRLP